VHCDQCAHTEFWVHMYCVLGACALVGCACTLLVRMYCVKGALALKDYEERALYYLRSLFLAQHVIGRSERENHRQRERKTEHCLEEQTERERKKTLSDCTVCEEHTIEVENRISLYVESEIQLLN